VYSGIVDNITIIAIITRGARRAQTSGDMCVLFLNVKVRHCCKVALCSTNTIDNTVLQTSGDQ